MSNIHYIEPPTELRDQVLMAIALGQTKRVSLKRRLVLASAFLSSLSLGYMANLAVGSVVNSGAIGYLNLIFTGASLYWKEILQAFLQALPLSEITATLALLWIFMKLLASIPENCNFGSNHYSLNTA